MVEIRYPAEIIKPDAKSLDELRASFTPALNRAKEITEREKLNSPEGKFVLTFLLTTGSLLKSVGTNLDKNIGGPAHNPEKEIDLVGGEIADTLIKEFLSNSFDYAGTQMYIEERKRWEKFPKNITPLAGKNARRILIDPCDETSSPGYRSVGISIFDKEGNFLSGGVAGLEDDIVVFIEENRVGFVDFNGGKNSVKDPLSTKFAPGVPEQLKIATLSSRLADDERIWNLARKISPKRLFIYKTFGGYGLIQMLKGDIDLMIDITKGQPWYEAAQWGALAEKLGFSVQYQSADIPDAKYFTSQPTPVRIRTIISRNKEIYEATLESLQKQGQVSLKFPSLTD